MVPKKIVHLIFKFSRVFLITYDDNEKTSFHSIQFSTDDDDAGLSTKPYPVSSSPPLSQLQTEKHFNKNWQLILSLFQDQGNPKATFSKMVNNKKSMKNVKQSNSILSKH